MRTEYRKVPGTEVKIHHSFDVLDSRGRLVGVNLFLWEADFVTAAEGARAFSTRAPGRYFALGRHATRNGRNYGASQGWRFYLSIEERMVAIEKYLKDASKRAMKKAL